MIEKEKVILSDLERMVTVDMIKEGIAYSLEGIVYSFEPKERRKRLITKFWESRLDDQP